MCAELKSLHDAPNNPSSGTTGPCRDVWSFQLEKPTSQFWIIARPVIQKPSLTEIMNERGQFLLYLGMGKMVSYVDQKAKVLKRRSAFLECAARQQFRSDKILCLQRGSLAFKLLQAGTEGTPYFQSWCVRAARKRKSRTEFVDKRFGACCSKQYCDNGIRRDSSGMFCFYVSRTTGSIRSDVPKMKGRIDDFQLGHSDMSLEGMHRVPVTDSPVCQGNEKVPNELYPTGLIGFIR